MKATKIKSLALGLLVALAGLSGCISYDNQDQYCDFGTDPKITTDACPYGPPGGAAFTKRPGCLPVDVYKDLNDANCQSAPTWSTLWPTLIQTQEGRCADGGPCHGSGAKGIRLSADAASAFTVLKNYTGASDRPYISDEKPDQAWILCNLTPSPNGGTTMPGSAGLPGFPESTTWKQLLLWAQCGQKP
jgi:hypothetical protein